jgi:hypothetical protein
MREEKQNEEGGGERGRNRRMRWEEENEGGGRRMRREEEEEEKDEEKEKKGWVKQKEGNAIQPFPDAVDGAVFLFRIPADWGSNTGLETDYLLHIFIGFH